MRNLELRHLRYALAAQQHGSFAQAAAVLQVEPSALSRGVRDLEDLLGVDIFERLPRGIRPTLAGAEFLDRAESIMQGVKQAQAAALNAGKGSRGRLAVGYVFSVARGPGAELIAAFRAANPTIELSLVAAAPGQLVRLLDEGKLDIALLGSFGNYRVIPREAERFDRIQNPVPQGVSVRARPPAPLVVKPAILNAEAMLSPGCLAGWSGRSLAGSRPNG